MRKETIETLLPGVTRNVPLKQYTTFRIGGPARSFFVATTQDDIIAALRAARKAGLPVLLLGEGSNVLVADKGFSGLVIKLENKKYAITGITLVAEAGVSMAELVRITCNRRLAGLAWAGGLPGTLGGAVRGNAGAFGGETKNVVVSVIVLDKRLQVRTVSQKACRFSYRSSLFKERGWIVLSATLRLKKGNASLLKKEAEEHKRYRAEHHPLDYPNAGSMFKNVPLAKAPKSVQQQAKKAGAVKTDPFPVIPAAYLIAEAGLSGLQSGAAQVSKKHPNYIVNTGNATARDVRTLLAKVKQTIQEKYHITLEEEVQYVGIAF